MSLLDLFRPPKKQRPTKATGSDTLVEISKAMDKLPPSRARYIAAFAFILGRVANADLDISAEEIDEMERIVERIGGLPEDQAALVVKIVEGQHQMFGTTENFVVTQEFNQTATLAQKRGLLSCLFAVSSSDNSISVKEDNEIREISKELRLEHTDFIAVRSQFREHLSVLKG